MKCLKQQELDIRWTGPYGWPKFGNDLAPIPSHSGIYLWTVEYLDGYLIYCAGLTRRPFARRLAEHTRSFMLGNYNVLEIGAMQCGIRKEVWHGWGWTPEKRRIFQKRNNQICAAVRKQLTGFRIFVADITVRGRILERVEAAILNTLYAAGPPFCNIPDEGMLRLPRQASEIPIVARNLCSEKLHGLPSKLQI